MGFLDNLLNFGDEVSNSAPLADRIMLGLQTTLLGMGVVFSVLIILWAVLAVFKLVFYKGNGEKTVPKSTVPDIPVAEKVNIPVQPTADDAELVAAITAAISIVMDKGQTTFRVVSFRRTASK